MNEVTPDLLTVDQAIAVLDSVRVTPRVKRVRLEEAQGLRLAQDILADRDYPPFDKSLMDGYAVRCSDVKAAPVELEVVGEVAAGQRHLGSLKPGQAIAIMTGAPMPDGADGVIPIEDILPLPPGEGGGEGASDEGGRPDAERRPDSSVIPHPSSSPPPHSLTLTLSQGERGRIRVMRAQGPQKFIARRGFDCASGVVVVTRGTKLESAQLAVAASVGAAQVEVIDRPHVAVLSTGDELVGIDQIPGPAQIRNSNNIMLVSLLKRMDCDVTDLGVARDDPTVIRAAIERGLKFDMLLVSGGMSMGQYDFVPRILKELGAELKITKLRIKPGKPFVFAQINDSFIFGLPGNPVSGFVCTLRLCSRLIARLSGVGTLEKWRSATLIAPVDPNGPREFYQPAILTDRHVNPLKWKGSADIYTLSQANALIVRPENAPAIPAGEVVRVLEIPS